MSASPASASLESSLLSPPISSELWQRHWDGPPLRLGVLASGSGSNFEAIAQAIAKKELNAEICGLIYNNPQAKAAERADRLGISKVLLNHREFPSRETLDGAIAQTFYDQGVDWVIMAGWMRIVTQVLIDAFPGRLLNIHPSLLPSFKGAHAIEQALASGARITGCTVHLVSLEVDSGPILVQAAVPILPGDTVETLHQRIQAQEHRIYPLGIAIAAAS
ncbi:MULTISPECIES: phosphoribosylglycinamide formyltransferase [unclassified Leptolyngbya]|uniref:phosphoribosylglycinamide formyltransferase n=1 Tax=unclassified Leptolyngbya TaxID=2650499 RepID=UPI00168230FF|nr:MULTISPECIES: phosphoribosylglycinamide formyltransferase [unclassified Leptolyngbya]MBD1912193.1 phosphoribosylglycinamide formyltransferase [Leptolyngbya sp. FACHB-8]MBD2155084.1 phosphoribosylglycinamide formyltransferase [Leptolyngbya sp. FACHB-16]